MKLIGDFIKALHQAEGMRHVVENRPTDFSPDYLHHLKVVIEALKIAIREEVEKDAQLRELAQETK